MTIVASNSLTVSNVNDGTITHTAYAYSADGTDRFTTVYPNLNLWKNSKLQSYTSKGTSTNISSLIYQLDVSGLNIIGVPINIYYDYEVTNSSGTWSGNINPFYGFRGDTSSSVSSSNLKGTFNKQVVLNNANTSCAIMASGLPTGTIVTIKNLKMELGSTTPWMPSQQEVTTADYPNFIGQYTDFTQADSTTASSYTWRLTRGNDGAPGPQGKPTGITQQATEPTNKYAGMMWQYTGTSNITIGNTTIVPQVQYIYDGSQWLIYAINVANLNVQTLAAITANLGTVTAGMIKSYIDYTYYNNSATGIPAKAYLRIDANNVNQKIALQSPSGVDWGYIRQDVNGITIFTDTQNSGSIGSASGRYIRTAYSGAGISFINSNNASVNANGDLDVATPYTGTGSLYFDGTNLISSAPIIALNTIVKSYAFTVGGLGIRLDRLMSQVMVTFSGQVTSAITGTPTFNNQLPNGFCPINPASVDYMVVGNSSVNGYIYFNPDGSIRFMADVPQGAYIRGTRSYITADAYPS